MLARLFGMVFVIAVGWLLGRLLGGPRRRSAPGGARPSTPKTGTMVRDRVCNTFLPRSHALVVRSGAEELYFCSETCRNQWSANAGRDCA